MPTHARRMNDRDDDNPGVAYAITKPFDPETLDAEITAAHNWRNPAGLIWEDDPAGASEDSPVVVWVVRDDVDTNTLKKVVTAHKLPEPDPDTTVLTTVMEKVHAGDDLTAPEMQVAIRALLRRGR